MARALHIEPAMHRSTSCCGFAFTVLAFAGSARADHTPGEYRYHARTHAVAAVEPSHAYSAAQANAVAAAPTPALGELAITPAATAPTEHAPLAPWLSTHDITATVAPHAAEIEHCYVGQLAAAAPGGTLDLKLEIARDGRVRALTAAAAGLSRPASHTLEACVRAALDGVAFPARRNDTTAVVPYLFHRASAPGAGPIPSCWSAAGCR